MVYPSSVPDWNKLRYLTPDEMDTLDKVVIAIEMPEQYASFFMGAFSSLLEINNWELFGIVAPETMVDVGNNEVRIVNLCEAIADCISNDVDVQQAIINQITLNPDVSNSVVQAGSETVLFGTDGSSEVPQFDDLDYVYGGLLGALVVWQDAVVNLFVLMNAATDALDAILGLPGQFPPTDLYTTVVREAFDFGMALVEADLKSTTSEENFICAIFDEICARGQPYILTDDDIKAGMAAITFGSFPQPFFNFNKFKQYFAINSDEPDNDWTVLCSCAPSTCIETDLEQEATFPDPPFQVLTSATFVPNTGVRGTLTSQNAAMSWNSQTGAVEITSATFDFQGGSTPLQTIFIQYFDGTNWITLAQTDGTTTMRRTLSWSGSVVGTRVRFINEPLGSGEPNWIYKAGVCYVE